MRRSLFVLMAIVTACGGGAAEPESDTTTSTPVEVTATGATTTTTEASTTTLDEWDAIKAWRGGPAGEYRTTTFQPAFRFSTPSAFQTDLECAEYIGIIKTAGEELLGILFIRFGPDTIDGTIDYLNSLEPLTVGESQPVAIGGADGVSLHGSIESNLVVPAPCTTQSWLFSSGTDMTLHIVDVDGEIVTIWVDEIPSVPPEDIQTIMDSIVWKDLS